jgi:glycosyltransferase involved in cell wall biosynthesis
MKIFHINTSPYGGAAIAAIRLHTGMVESGMSSSMLTLAGSSRSIPNHHAYRGPVFTHKPVYPTLTLKNWFAERLFKGYEKEKKAYEQKQAFQKKITTPEKRDGYNCFELFSLPHSPYDITQTEAYKKADIIHLHWVEGFLDYPSFFAKNDKPVVWTLHDECPYLGGFHYEGDLLRNQATHGNQNEHIRNVKKEAIRHAICKVTAVSPSDWLAEKAGKSEVFKGCEVTRIRNGLDQKRFRNIDKRIAREFFDLPQGKQIFLVSAAHLDTYRKGIDRILPLFDMTELQDVFFLLAGTGLPEFSQPNVSALSNVGDERLLPLVYSAADAFILPSREDNLPNTMLEAIACATPVIAFDIGDNKSFIGEQGIIVKDTDELIHSLIHFREHVFDFSSPRSDFELHAVVGQYRALYDSLL